MHELVYCFLLDNPPKHVSIKVPIHFIRVCQAHLDCAHRGLEGAPLPLDGVRMQEGELGMHKVTRVVHIEVTMDQSVMRRQSYFRACSAELKVASMLICHHKTRRASKSQYLSVQS
jgi:hypothetical protein